MATTQPTANAFGIGMGTKDYASRTFEALTRQQWDTYLSEFVPLENQMIQYAMSDATVDDAVMQARHDVGQAFDQQQGMQQRRLRGYGLQLDEDEQRAADRSTGLARSLADVNAANLTTQRVRDRQNSLLGNPAPAMGAAGAGV